MSVLRQVLSEIYAMFAGDAVMTGFAVIIVAIASALRLFTHVSSTLIGFAVFAASVTLLITRVYVYARRHRRVGSNW
jgi:hypothetical protein